MRQIMGLKEPIGQILKVADLFDKIKKVKIDYTKENFLVFFLDSKSRVIKTEVIFMGGLNSCVVDVRTLFRAALKVNANSIIIAHNHPSRDLSPSYEDREIYDKLREAGKILQINVLVSVVFNKTEYYSMN